MLSARPPAYGKGKAHAHAHGEKDACFSNLSYQYPLKLLSPTAHAEIPLAIAYILSYGGGLVSGDRIELDVQVGKVNSLAHHGAFNLALAVVPGNTFSVIQGSTKVFKTRTHKHHAESSYIPSDTKELVTSRTTQCMDARVSTDAILLLLPDPVTPFSSASYSQTQKFYLEEHSSAVILDWFTSGRMARGEEWAFEKYRSVNEIWKQGRRIARDVMLLESPKDSVSATNGNAFSRSRSVRERLAPYACYATLFILVPSKPTTLMNEINPEASTPSPIRLRTYHKLTEIISQLSEAYDEIRQMQTSSTDSIIWSLSPLNQPVPAESNDAAGSDLVIRVAGLTTELVRNWLKRALAPLNGLIGHDAYKNVFA